MYKHACLNIFNLLADAVVVASVYGPYEMKHTKIEDDMPFQVTFKPKAGPTSNLTACSYIE